MTSNTPDEIELIEVVMPVVLVMNLTTLTFGQRAACAEAIKLSLKQYGELVADQPEEVDVKLAKRSR